MAERFVREKKRVVGGGKLRNRKNPSAADFLARLWSRFGPPDDVGYEGFTYRVRDTRSGLAFHAYSAGSGPAYGGEPDKRFAGVLRAFDAWIAAAPLADCRIQIETDFGPYELGAQGGVAFERAIKLGAPAKSARTIEECLTNAAKWGRGDLPGGFARCLEEVLELGDEATVDGLDAEPICLCPGMDDITVFYDAGTKTFNVPLEKAPLPKQSEVGKIWLAAWAKWRGRRR